MKLWAKSKNGKMLKVGDVSETSKWFFMTTEVIAEVGNFNVGDDVTIETKSEAGSEFITKMTKGSGLSHPTASKGVTSTQPKTPPPAPPVAQGITTGAKPDVGVTPQKAGYLPKEEWIAQQKAKGLWNDSPKSLDKGADTNASIKRQAIGNMTSRAMISMQGVITPDNMEEIAEKLYKKFQELVG